ncbi:MBOAT family O-acyltransferase [Rhodopila sp.]|uniref:MBOAT family O-acyltransferase n=1 Tax=Rhodopila sp. TaxID=2480087 RepID=UPI003D0AC60A
MPFNSFLFLLGFLPVTVGGYAVICRLGSPWAKVWLIAVSLLFYGVAALGFLPLLLLSVSGNLLLLRAMSAVDRRGWLAALGCVLNLVLLGWFKYAQPVLWQDPVLPLGISFFTFTQIGCLLSHAGGTDPAPRPATYALFVLFFPALTAGPILNPREMLPQFDRAEGWRLSADNLAAGAGFFLIGLLKKTLLADPLSGVVAAGFAAPGALSLLPAWQAAIAWSMQLYFDFSGYSDMAVGLARMFGIHFPDNFEQPYCARSVIQYWQRWHMSLTRFLMANIHAPLTLAILRRRRTAGLPINQAAQQTPAGFLGMVAVPILLTMILAGIWHGPALTFLLFGLLHVVFLLINHAWRIWRAPSLAPLLAVALTYLSVLTGAVLFRADSVADAAAMLSGMAGLHGAAPLSADLHGIVDTLWIIGLYAIIWLVPSTRQWMQGGASRLSWRPTPGWAVAMGCAATLGLLASGGTGEFVYFHF